MHKKHVIEVETRNQRKKSYEFEILRQRLDKDLVLV